MNQLSRRQLLKLGLASVASLAVPRRALSAPAPCAPRRPNFLIIHTDEQSTWTLGRYGAREIATPHLNRLAAEGAWMPNYFCNNAVCTPSRGTMMTGLHSHEHGAFRNDNPIKQSCETFAHVLRDKGYATGYVGKWHLDGSSERLAEAIQTAGRTGNFYRHPDLYNGWVPPERAMGFSDSRYMWDTGHWKSIRDNSPHPDFSVDVDDYPHYTTDWIANQAIAYMRAHREEPFCYLASIPDPHTPITVREPHASMYEPSAMHLHPQLEPPEWFKPHLEKATLAKEARKAGMSEEAYTRQRKAIYLGMVKRIDDQVGRLLAELDALGLAENTIVIHTSDHGEQMGQAGVFGKAQPFEASYRVPMIIRWPGHIEGGRQIQALASHVDLKPTLLGLAGLAGASKQQDHGKDFSNALLVDTAAQHQEMIFTQTGLRLCGVVTPKYFFNCFFDVKGKKLTTPVLFNRLEDPQNLVNLAALPEHRATTRELWHGMIEQAKAVHSPHISMMQAGYD